MPPSQEISVRVLDNGHRAVVCIPAAFDRSCITPALLSTIAAAARVQITANTQARFAAIIDDFKQSPRDLTADIVHAQPPVNGADGSWKWEPAFDPSSAPCVTTTDDLRTDHHASHVHSVSPGVTIARLTLPTDGTDGLAVTGEVIPAKPGAHAPLKPGEGLELKPDGTVVATVDGVLGITRDMVSVSQTLTINGPVDFSTGNLDFKGDIHITGAVRDGFTIRADRSVTIDGAVEGAEITCGGNLTCPRGIASSRRAKLLIAGNADIGYVRNALILVKGDVACRGEMEHSEVTVGGRLLCESGRVIGGSLILTGIAHIGTLGSPDWTPTVISVGDLPLVAMKLRQLDAEVVRLSKALAAKEEAIDFLRSSGSKSASAREQLTELQYELSELRREAAQTEVERVKLQDAMRVGGSAELHVAKSVFPRVRIQHGRMAFELKKELKGPLRFLLDQQGGIHVRVSTQNPRPITDVADAVKMPPVPIPAFHASCTG